MIPCTKNQMPHAVPVVGPLMEILTKRRTVTAAACPWVFPGASKAGHLSNPQRAWVALCRRAELDGLRIHDLRHTTGSWFAKGNSSLTITAQMLGHRSLEMTKRYSHLDVGPVRAAAEKAAAAMLAAGGNRCIAGASK